MHHDLEALPRWGFAFPGPTRDELTALALAGTKELLAVPGEGVDERQPRLGVVPVVGRSQDGRGAARRRRAARGVERRPLDGLPVGQALEDAGRP